jgi:hypothetical protein|tara:strand:- start:733 stop:1263 length:531 start_codon:yes stop_codon:yes gene_type:complete
MITKKKYKSQFGLLCAKKSEVLKKNNCVKQEIIDLLDVNCDDKEHLVFPMHDPDDKSLVIGIFRKFWEIQRGHQIIVSSRSSFKRKYGDLLYPLCNPNVTLDTSKPLHIVQTPLEVAELLSEGKNAIATFYKNTISNKLRDYIISNNIKEVICSIRVNKASLEKKLDKEGYNCILT